MNFAHATTAAVVAAAVAVAPLSTAQASVHVPTASFLLAQPGAPDPSQMSDEQKIERAKSLFGEGQAAYEASNYTAALAKWEEAYNVYAPSFHVFNFNIGQAAYELGDCAKAKVAFQRFLDLVPDHPERGTATERQLEIERSGCAKPATPTPAAAPAAAPTTSLPVEDDDTPLLTSRRDEREDASDLERQTKDAEKTDPLLLTGIILTSLGGAMLVGGGISAVLARGKAERLKELATAGPTGFPDGNYSDDEVFNLDNTGLPANNIATIGLLAGGGVIAGTGVALLVVGLKRQKAKRAKVGDKNANGPVRRRPRLTGVSPALMPRGGGAAATIQF